jgi:hypothetical protein
MPITRYGWRAAKTLPETSSRTPKHAAAGTFSRKQRRG